MLRVPSMMVLVGGKIYVYAMDKPVWMVRADIRVSTGNRAPGLQTPGRLCLPECLSRMPISQTARYQ